MQPKIQIPPPVGRQEHLLQTQDRNHYQLPFFLKGSACRWNLEADSCSKAW